MTKLRACGSVGRVMMYDRSYFVETAFLCLLQCFAEREWVRKCKRCSTWSMPTGDTSAKYTWAIQVDNHRILGGFFFPPSLQGLSIFICMYLRPKLKAVACNSGKRRSRSAWWARLSRGSGSQGVSRSVGTRLLISEHSFLLPFEAFSVMHFLDHWILNFWSPLFFPVVKTRACQWKKEFSTQLSECSLWHESKIGALLCCHDNTWLRWLARLSVQQLCCHPLIFLLSQLFLGGFI